MSATTQKRNGVHYTPSKLAVFLANQICRNFDSSNDLPKSTGGKWTLDILDPACGEGELLVSLIETLPISPANIRVSGFETDSQTAAIARRRLRPFGLSSVSISNEDFLQCALVRNATEPFDIVIANPPYVRTQVLGGNLAQLLAVQFGLQGRVDLSHAFVMAMARVLKPGGLLGLLTSNRFLTVKSGATLRKLFTTDFELIDIFDLGDTKLFQAAVLPVILTATKLKASPQSTDKKLPRAVGFHRVYSALENSTEIVALKSDASIIEVLAQSDVRGLVETSEGRYVIERGHLVPSVGSSVWSLSNPAKRSWLNQIRSRSVATFGELAEIKVGIKTTADAVFIRDDWDEMPTELQPESELLRPLLTHHRAGRWIRNESEMPCKQVLYPYEFNSKKRTPIELNRFPRAAKYLQAHSKRLQARKYLIDSGRCWYEIWVPHQPKDWAQPKIVWPDISEQPRFFLDSSGAIVNGDCYWIKLRGDVDPDWIYMMLAVANSSIATQYYDTVFHNKLYAGRRRFMTQYVKDFPLPALDSQIGKEIVSRVKKLTRQPTATVEQQVEKLVRDSFGI